jgi:hypothetical protein
LEEERLQKLNEMSAINTNASCSTTLNPDEKAEDAKEHVSLLDARGDGRLIAAAFRDPGSTVCSDCHGLIAQKRLESHRAFWCPALVPVSDDEDVK